MRKIKIELIRYISLFAVLCRKGKIFNLFSVLFSYLFKRSEVKGMPFVLQIEPTNKCDLHCRLCLTGLGKLKRAQGDMSFKRFRKVLDELGDSLIYLALYNLGEPLLNCDIYHMINYAKGKGVFIRLSTNGNFSDKKHIKSILNSGIDELIVSLDCATEETYSEFKKSSDFNRVIENVRFIIKERGSRLKPYISLQFLVMKSTEREIDIFKGLVKSLQVDKGIIKKVRIDFHNVKPVYDFLPRDKKYIRNIYKKKSEKIICWRPWLSTLILWDGTVVPCCFDMEGEFSFGNINDENLSLIWNNNKYLMFRKRIAENPDRSLLCRQCSIKNFSSNFISRYKFGKG